MGLRGPRLDDQGRAQGAGQRVVGEVDGLAQEGARGAAEDLIEDEEVVVVGDVGHEQSVAVAEFLRRWAFLPGEAENRYRE